MRGLFSDLDDLYCHVGEELLQAPIRSSRNGDAHEINGVVFKVINPMTLPVARRMSPIYAAAELLWYLTWDNRGDMISHYAPSYTSFLEYGADGVVRANGGYGTRWGQQIPRLLELLRSSHDTRRALLATWTTKDLGRDTVDQPCTVSLQFLIRDGLLHLIATMRSNDAWLGLAYDTFCFTRLQSLIAADLGIPVGTYQHQVGSMHLYTKDDAKMAEVVARGATEPKRYDYAQIPAGRMMQAAERATRLEAEIRKHKYPLSWARTEIVGCMTLKGTELGALVLTVAMKNSGLVATDGVDPSFVWTAQ